MIEIKSYGPAFEESHRQFATRHWTKRKRITPEYIYWKFRGKPGHELSGFILAIDQGIVIGQLGLVPCTVEINGRKVEAQWACDLMVDHAYRGQGVAKMLYEHAYLIKPLTLGSDASPAATISMKRSGFISLIGPRKFLFPMWLGEITKLKGYNFWLLNRSRNPFIYLLLIWRFFRNSKQKVRPKDIEAYTDYVNSIKRHKELSVLHDYDFAHWRYSSFKDYYKGVHLYVYNKASFFSLYQDRDLFLVTEWGANNLIGYLDLLCEIVGRAYYEGVSRIRILANSNLESAALTLCGSVRFRTRTDIIFYTREKELHDQLMNKYFYYTHLDSDENI